MKRKITLISFYFAPLGRADGINRSYLSRYLADLGWQVDVVCAENPRGLLRNYQRDPSLLQILGDNVRRHPVPYRFNGGWPELQHLLGLKSDPFYHWIDDAIRVAEPIAGEGIVYAVVPPVSNAAVAVEVARRRGLPLVLDFRDNVWNLPREWVQQAALILASTDWSRREMLRHYDIPDSTPSLTYFNGFPDEPETAQEVPVERKGVLYAGLMNWEQHPFLIGKTLAAANAKAPQLAQQLHADFFGPANYYTRLAFRGDIRRNASLHGYVSFGEIRRKFRAAQFGLTTLVARSKTYCIPSKVFQYIAAGLPLLAVSEEGALTELVAEHGIGLAATPSQAASLADPLIDLLRDEDRMAALRERVLAAKPLFSLRSQVARLSAQLRPLVESD